MLLITTYIKNLKFTTKFICIRINYIIWSSLYANKDPEIPIYAKYTNINPKSYVQTIAI